MKKRKKIGLLCSVEKECEEIISLMRGKRVTVIGVVTFISGELDSIRITLGITGIGKVNAAHGCGLMINRYKPQSIISFGIGGCYPTGKLAVGDVAVAEKEIYADEGVLGKDGFNGMKQIGIPLVTLGNKKIFNEFSSDVLLLKRFKKTAPKFPFRLSYGRFLTVSSVSGTPKRANELKNNFKGICENMEGAAVFHIARMYGVPCFAVRGISNIAGVRDKKRWDMQTASGNCQKVLIEFLRQLN
jgi:futalosine hydrolase